MMIFIIEDDRPIREMLVEILEDEGYLVQSVSNGQQALAALRTIPTLPKLVLLDLMMPVMDGWTFRQEQLQDPLLMGIPIIVLSAAFELHRQAAIIRAVSYLEKPIDIAKLIATVEQHYS